MIGGTDLLAQIENENPKLGQFLRNYMIPAVETTAQNAAVSSTSTIAAPASPAGVSVAVSGEMMHVSVADSSRIQKGIHYFTEIGVNDPYFTKPIVYHHGTSRTPPPFPLPTKDGSGTAVKYYVRSYSQYQGSTPSAPVAANGGAPITMAGTTSLALLPSAGSGTANGNGTQGGQGFGKSQIRIALGKQKAIE